MYKEVSLGFLCCQLEVSLVMSWVVCLLLCVFNVIIWGVCESYNCYTGDVIMFLVAGLSLVDWLLVDLLIVFHTKGCMVTVESALPHTLTDLACLVFIVQ